MSDPAGARITNIPIPAGFDKTASATDENG